MAVSAEALAAASVSPPMPTYHKGRTTTCLQRQRTQGAHMFLSTTKLQSCEVTPACQQLHLMEIKGV